MISNSSFQVYVEIYRKESYQGQVISTGDEKKMIQAASAVLEYVNEDDVMSSIAKALELTIEYNLIFNGIVTFQGSLDNYEFHVRRNFNNMVLEPISYPLYIEDSKTVVKCQEKEDIGYEKNDENSMGVW